MFSVKVFAQVSRKCPTIANEVGFVVIAACLGTRGTKKGPERAPSLFP
jgi:hypothetical protein